VSTGSRGVSGVSPHRPFVIDLAPGAEHVPLARELVLAVQTNVARDRARRADFEKLRGAVALVADDSATSLTLRFDFGRLVVHTGVIGVPDVTIRGATRTLEALGNVRRPGLGAAATRALRSWVTASDPDRDAPGGLQIYGRATHPFLVRRFFSVVSK